MTKPKNFIMNSDYATTQNDDKKTMSYTIPSGTVIANGATRVFEANDVVGTRNAYIRAQSQTSSVPGRWFAGMAMITDVNVSLPGVGTLPWPVYHTVERTSPTSVRTYCEILNNTGLSMTIATSQTITWEINTFLSPFPN